jgi:hypothetical protein
MLQNGPVIMGGIGGSGTRVMAEIVSLFGFYIGKDLNAASDNLSYTLLFKRPRWFKKNFNNTAKINTGFRILENSLIKGERLTLREKIFLMRAVRGMSKYGHNKEGEGKGDWPSHRLPFIKFPQLPDTHTYRGWGWKEPNSHLLIPKFGEYFQHFKYIHTIRHGLDMAFSKNQQQLFNWASLYGVDMPFSQDDVPGASFRYWVEANRKAISLGNQLGSGKFLLVNFDELCIRPLEGVKQIADFLQINPSAELLSAASKLPVIPRTTGRYKDYNLDKFDPEDLSFLKELGFSY